MRKSLVLLIAILAASIFCQAQQKTGKITGSVHAAGNTKTLESASIALLKASDSSAVKLTVADKTGQFVFEGIREGQYIVAVSIVGHKKNFTEVFGISATTPSVNLKPIEMVPAAIDLKEVSVSSKRPFIEQKIDRLVVNVEASVTSMGSTAFDVLEKSPGISVDKDGNISLKGKQGVIVLIDGRESRLDGTDLANYLRSMTASQLDQIEIMTNPPARFDASGTAGVINIKTKKLKQMGYNGSLNLGYGQGRYPKINDGLNLNYRKNKVNVFTNLSHNYNRNYNRMELQRTFRDKVTKNVLSIFDQEANMQNKSNNVSGKIGLDYFVNNRTTFGFAVNGYMSKRNSDNNNTTLISNGAGVLQSKTLSLTPSDQLWKSFSTNFNFRRVLDSAGSELTADADYVVYDSQNDQNLINAYFNASGAPTFKSDTLVGDLPQNIKIRSGRVDYTRILKKGMRFEAGVKASFVKTDNNAVYDSIQYGQVIHDLNRSNHFIYEENINAVYANFSTPLGKKWNAQAGVRMENTNAKGNQVTTGEKFDRHYSQLFPTLYLQYKPDDKHSFVINYGKRIRRPDYQRLNPFINFLDKYTYQQGNPNLKPQFSHNIELSHGYRGIITTTLNYTRTTDIIQQVLEQDELKNETYMTPANIAKQQQFGLSVNTTIPIAKWWKSNVFVNVFNNLFEGIVNDTLIKVSATSFSLNGSQQFNFAKTWSAELSGFYRSAGIEGVIQSRALGGLSAGVSKEIMKKKATIRMNIRDIFYTQGFRGKSKYGNVDATFQENRDSRVINLGFTYRFSKGKMGNGAKRRAGSASDEQNRVGQ